jgi:hypothetical protein
VVVLVELLELVLIELELEADDGRVVPVVRVVGWSSSLMSVTVAGAVPLVVRVAGVAAVVAVVSLLAGVVSVGFVGMNGDVVEAAVEGDVVGVVVVVVVVGGSSTTNRVESGGNVRPSTRQITST